MEGTGEGVRKKEIDEKFKSSTPKSLHFVYSFVAVYGRIVEHKQLTFWLS
jgi:hypothetical protein